MFYNTPDFIADDPISVPHEYSKRQDIEIAGLFAAVFAWGLRKTIIKKCHELFELMDNEPYNFIINHSSDDLKPFLKFKHRTFNATDTLYFIHWLRWYYSKEDSLETAFMHKDLSMRGSLIGFHHLFFSLLEAPNRSRKHISTPERNSACKRLNMYLRWMVRDDDKGVDFGLWKNLKPANLICPCDLHVDRIARKFQLITRKQIDWRTAIQLTENLKKMDPEDPIKYDFALFGLGVIEKF
ncbi:MAG: TIGR02757 family protein [Flammeovirgaceae bacterium]|nr:TIGR02757 family protein [Flammeovirgaceae bacterium]